jgi:hypothetical protein
MGVEGQGRVTCLFICVQLAWVGFVSNIRSRNWKSEEGRGKKNSEEEKQL